jgi:hypothetical protein
MPEPLRSTLHRLTSDLRSLNHRLQSEPPEHGGELTDFREILDGIRLTAWTAHELAKARKGEGHATEVLVLTANERARRFREMALNLCSDLDSGFLARELAREALEARLDALRERLMRVDGPSTTQS